LNVSHKFNYGGAEVNDNVDELLGQQKEPKIRRREKKGRVSFYFQKKERQVNKEENQGEASTTQTKRLRTHDYESIVYRQLKRYNGAKEVRTL